MSVYFETSEDIAWREWERTVGYDEQDDFYPGFELDEDMQLRLLPAVQPEGRVIELHGPDPKDMAA